MTELSQMKWRCRRGIKELDIILSKYLEENYNSASQDEQQAFREILYLEDPVLFSFLLDTEKPDNPEQIALINKLKNLFFVP